MQNFRKDYIRDGYLLALNLDSWDKISKKARWSIKKAKEYGLQVGQSSFASFKSLCENVTWTPVEIKGQMTFLAWHLEVPVAGCVIAPQNDILLHKYAVTTEHGRHAQAQSLLIWWMVEQYHHSRFRYLDLGPSYHPDRDHFKRQFATEKYPVIYDAPIQSCPVIVSKSDPYIQSELAKVGLREVPLLNGVFESFGIVWREGLASTDSDLTYAMAVINGIRTG